MNVAPHLFRSTPGVPSFPPRTARRCARRSRQLPINPRSSFVPTPRPGPSQSSVHRSLPSHHPSDQPPEFLRSHRSTGERENGNGKTASDQPPEFLRSHRLTSACRSCPQRWPSDQPPKFPRSHQRPLGCRITKSMSHFRSTPGVPSFPPRTALLRRSAIRSSDQPPEFLRSHRLEALTSHADPNVFRSTPGVPSFPPRKRKREKRPLPLLPINPRSSFVPTSSRKSQVTPMT